MINILNVPVVYKCYYYSFYNKTLSFLTLEHFGSAYNASDANTSAQSFLAYNYKRIVLIV